MLKKIEEKRVSRLEAFKTGLYSGVGWSFGVTIGFVLVSAVLAIILQSLGGLPLIGGFIADVVQETNSQLLKRTPVIERLEN
jgi:ABC-type enterochelin transport system permease subunit